MYSMFFLAAFLAIMGTVSNLLVRDHVPERAAAQAANLLAYKNAAVEYAHANPAFTGTPPDAAVHAFAVTGYVERWDWVASIDAGGQVTVFTGDASLLNSAAIVDALAKQTEGSVLVGVTRSSTLRTALGSDTGIASTATEGSPTAIGYRY